MFYYYLDLILLNAEKTFDESVDLTESIVDVTFDLTESIALFTFKITRWPYLAN